MDLNSENMQLKNQGAYVENGELKFSFDKLNDSEFIVKLNPSEHMRIFIDNHEFEKLCEVTSKSEVKIELVTDSPERKLNINVSEDKLKVYASIEYTPQQEYKLKDMPISKRIDFVEELKQEILPPLYTVDEVKKVLESKNIVYGFLIENIKKLCEDRSGNEYIIAEGKEVIDSIQDTVKQEFEKEIVMRNNEDSKNIDFRDIKDISMVYPGQTIAEIIIGKEGEDGLTVYNKPIKCSKYISGVFSFGEGVAKKDNFVVATIEGMPRFKNNLFTVSKLYQVDGNVDLSTGNVSFIGSVLINGNVLEGMTVAAGHDINIKGNADLAKILSKGDLHITGNVIGSTIVIGGDDVVKKQELNTLINLKNAIIELQEAAFSIKEKNFSVNKHGDGDILKLLIESKFKCIVSDCMSIIRYNLKEKGQLDDLIVLVKEKLIGLAPVNIKHVSELDCIKDVLAVHIERLTGSVKIHSKACFSYIQGTDISCSGDVFIEGKGAYTSNIIANNSIYFIRKDSALRGGRLQAEKEIKCGIIGSEGSVKTCVEIVGNGHIWAEVAYANTVFIIKGKTITLQENSKNIHVYIDDSNMIEIDKLRL